MIEENEMNEQGCLRYRGVCWVAIILSIVAIIVSIVALLQSRAASESLESNNTYRRIVTEVWTLVEKTYIDLGLRAPSGPPETLTEALQPLVELAQPVGLDSTSREGE